LIAASFGFIDEASKRWARVVFKLLALIVFGYCTLYSPSGRSFLTAVLGIFKTESHVLAVPTQATVNWEILYTFLSSVFVSGFVVWLMREWISNRIKGKIEHEYEAKLEGIRSEYAKELANLNSALQESRILRPPGSA
jgi:hypothetical protein